MCWTSNCAYDGAAGGALEFIEHAFKLRIPPRCVAAQVAIPGHRGALHAPISARPSASRAHHHRTIQGMHDAVHVAKGGKIAGQSQNHGWFVFDRNYFGKPDLNFVSINDPTARMPWARDAARWRRQRSKAMFRNRATIAVNTILEIIADARYGRIEISALAVPARQVRRCRLADRKRPANS